MLVWFPALLSTITHAVDVQMAHAMRFWTFTLQDLFNSIKNTSMWTVFIPAIEFWIFESPIFEVWVATSHFPQSGVAAHSFSQVFPKIKWMVDPLTQGKSYAFIRTIPFLDEILISLLCHCMSTLFWVTNPIPKMESIPCKVETNKSTFPLQFPSWKGISFACNVMRWGTPSRKCTLMGALNSSNWSSILSSLSQVMKLWKALALKRHNTFRLTIFPFKKISQLHSAWARLTLKAITLELAFPALNSRQSLK